MTTVISSQSNIAKESLSPRARAAWGRLLPLMLKCGWRGLPLATVHPDGSLSIIGNGLLLHNQSVNVVLACLKDGEVRAAITRGVQIERLIVNFEDPSTPETLRAVFAHVFHGEPMQKVQKQLVRID